MVEGGLKRANYTCETLSGSRLCARLVIEKLWVQILPGVGLFSLPYPLSIASLIQVPRGGAALMIFLEIKLSCAA